jgi:hypothetical protein
MDQPDPLRFEWGIDRITFSDGSTYPVARDTLTVIIGPNNSGKSVALREIHRHLNPQHNADFMAVPAIERFRDGREQDFRAWLDSHYRTVVVGGKEHWRTLRGNVAADQITSHWAQDHRLVALNPFLVHVLDQGSKLSGHSAEKKPFRFVCLHPLEADGQMGQMGTVHLSSSTKKPWETIVSDHLSAAAPPLN